MDFFIEVFLLLTINLAIQIRVGEGAVIQTDEYLIPKIGIGVFSGINVALLVAIVCALCMVAYRLHHGPFKRRVQYVEDVTRSSPGAENVKRCSNGTEICKRSSQFAENEGNILGNTTKKALHVDGVSRRFVSISGADGETSSGRPIYPIIEIPDEDNHDIQHSYSGEYRDAHRNSSTQQLRPIPAPRRLWPRDLQDPLAVSSEAQPRLAYGGFYPQAVRFHERNTFSTPTAPVFNATEYETSVHNYYRELAMYGYPSGQAPNTLNHTFSHVYGSYGPRYPRALFPAQYDALTYRGASLQRWQFQSHIGHPSYPPHSSHMYGQPSNSYDPIIVPRADEYPELHHTIPLRSAFNSDAPREPRPRARRYNPNPKQGLGDSGRRDSRRNSRSNRSTEKYERSVRFVYDGSSSDDDSMTSLESLDGSDISEAVARIDRPIYIMKIPSRSKRN